MAGLFVAMYQLVDYSEQKDLVDRQRYQVVTLGKAITNAESGQRGYLLTGHTLFLDALEQGQAEAMKAISLLEHDLDTSSAARPLLANIKQLVQQKFNAMDKSVQVQMHAGEYAPHLSLSRDRGRELMKLIDGQLAQIDEQLLIKRQWFEQAIRNRILASVTVAILLSIVIISVLVFSYRSTTLLLEQVMENQAVAKQLSHQADHDLLTSLPNRRSVNVYLESTYEMARIGSKQFAVFFMDLDGFKRVNDAYGHDVGDALLIEVANMFKRVLRQSDFLARQGGDEFVLVVSSYLHRLELTQLAQRLIHLFAQPVVVRGIPLEIGVSIGIAEYPHHGKNVKQLLHVADKAMYDSKKNGKNRFSFGE
ncbi:diguanylate cyclase domain-containing protein [Methylophilus glucosoxydans]|uniref:Diguanylate cyclase domain-containing protein n=1 Tax=Methylophilus glucosoxydans TaxID=752553 RepID=A0ABW3GCQ7_9PROT